MFENGDTVFYKREGKDRWLSWGNLAFQDSKVVFVRHAWIFELVSPNRLYKINSLGPTEEAQKDIGQRVNDSVLSKSNQKDNTKGKID